MSETMDTSFQFFYEDEGFGPAIHSIPVPVESQRKYQGKLPDQLLKYWHQYGWSGYGEGLFWTVNPDDYAPVVAAWLEGTGFIDDEEHHVIARSAFGELFLWGEKSGQNLSITSCWSMIFPRDQREKIKAGRGDVLASRFFSSTTKKELDDTDENEKPMFQRAMRKLGPLAPDEMYGFVPALVLGGKCEVKFLRKVKAIEHLLMLAQLQAPRVMDDIVKVAKQHGLM
ncbi:GAD-like domain-containing protein [Nevskia sp.]|uniref:GAD-like domain-containing protein n=1 Tax=Nevskia sp. TaxID=1929292 RepID=UPI0025F4026D|nr:GAD-like domain-containing protein [Nevskia sp.]